MASTVVLERKIASLSQPELCEHYAKQWDREASNLRELAAERRQTEAARASLLSQAEIADRMAAFWRA